MRKGLSPKRFTRWRRRTSKSALAIGSLAVHMARKLVSWLRFDRRVIPRITSIAIAVPSTAREELPLRSEIFGVDQLQLHAKIIAGWHKLAQVPGRNQLLSRLADNEEVLL